MKVKIWKLLGLLSIVIFMLSIAGSVHAASLTSTIKTGVGPIGVVYDPAMHEIFVDNYYGGDIQVISDSTNQQVADVTALTQYAGAPFNLAYDSVKGEIWVADATGAYAISDATNTIVANVSDTNGLELAAFDSKTGEVFMSYNGNIAVISDSSNTIIANITQSVTGMVDDSVKSEIFAATGSEGSGVVNVISANTNAVTTTIPISSAPDYLAYDSGKGEIYVAGSVLDSNTGLDTYNIQVISDSTNKVVATIDLPTGVTLGDMAYNPNKGEIYINDLTSVAIISDSAKNVVGTVNTNGTNTYTGSNGIAYDSGTSTVYAINDGGSTEGFMGSLAVISDPSSGTSNPTATPTSSTSTSTGSTPTPKVPEFSNVALISVAAAIVAVTFCTVALTVRTRKTLPR
jgi:DNA-binding beta-propeller fold protein YncE